MPPSSTAEEWEAEIWLTGITELLAEMSYIDEISAIAVSGNGPTLVPVDRAGVPVGPALLWADSKSERISGEPSFFLPKANWLKIHREELYRGTDRFLTCPDFITYTITGEQTAAIPSEEFGPYLWAPDSIRRYELEEGMFPPFVHTGELIGRVTSHAAGRFGLPVDVPVYAGGSDFLMALLGTGAVQPGRTCDRAGTSEGINYCSDVLVQSDRLRSLPHVISGMFNIAGILSSTGRIFEWFREISGQRRRPYEQMLGEIHALDHEASRPVFLPSVHAGSTWEFRGAAFVALEPEHGVREMGRSVVESIGFAIRDLVDTLEENGCPIDVIRVSGGQARSAIWNQMKADITGKEIWVPRVVDAELVGNAAAALMGLGRFPTLQEASEALVGFQEVYIPNGEETSRHDVAYKKFKEMCERVIGKMGSSAGGLSE